jgi:lipid II:glycine glycyltransferase (peptidoglycan interpeptide bridge formation enzyme)
MQSLHWQRLKHKQGMRSLHLGIFEGDNLIGGSIFYASPKSNGAGLLVAPEGPIIPFTNPQKAAPMLAMLIDEVKQAAPVFGAMAMRIEPRLPPPQPKVLREFGRAPVNLVPRETLYIDLSPDLGAIRQAMKPKGRYNLRLSERNGIKVVEDNLALDKFYAVLQEASKRDDFALESYRFFENIVQVLCPSGCARMLFAEHEGETLASALITNYGNRATYLYGGITNRKRNLMAGYALQWRAIVDAKESGAKIYDFYGIDPFRAPENEYARFSQFKTRFGGEVVRFIGAQDYFFVDNLVDAFVKAVNEVGA